MDACPVNLFNTVYTLWYVANTTVKPRLYSFKASFISRLRARVDFERFLRYQPLRLNTVKFSQFFLLSQIEFFNDLSFWEKFVLFIRCGFVEGFGIIVCLF